MSNFIAGFLRSFHVVDISHDYTIVILIVTLVLFINEDANTTRLLLLISAVGIKRTATERSYENLECQEQTVKILFPASFYCGLFGFNSVAPGVCVVLILYGDETPETIGKAVAFLAISQDKLL